MKSIRLSGWALILSALIFLFEFAWDHLFNGPYTLFTVLLGVIGNILFLVGLPGIQQSQPQTRWPGQIGLIHMGIGAVIAIIANLLIRLAGINVDDWVPLTSANVGALGSMIIGCLTIRSKMFRLWIGWLSVAGAILNNLFPILPPTAVFISQIGLFTQSVEFMGNSLNLLKGDLEVHGEKYSSIFMKWCRVLTSPQAHFLVLLNNMREGN